MNVNFTRVVLPESDPRTQSASPSRGTDSDVTVIRPMAHARGQLPVLAVDFVLKKTQVFA